VVSYLDVLLGKVQAAERVAVIGAGGIGFDVAEFLVHDGLPTSLDLPRWQAEWGWMRPSKPAARCCRPSRSGGAQVWLLQRSRQARRAAGQDHRLDPPRHAEGQGRADARRRRVPGLDDAGLRIRVDGAEQVLPPARW
jgi:2,4-dienoyl-CoA reductase (NADPH2)